MTNPSQRSYQHGPRARALAVATALVAMVATPERASGEDALEVEHDGIVCRQDHTTAIEVDGLQADWEEEARPVDRATTLIEGERAVDWIGGADASFRLWCRADSGALYFAIAARDDVLTSGDRFELRFALPSATGARDALTTVSFGTGDPEGTPRPDVECDGNCGHATARAELALREQTGYFAEIEVPLRLFGDAPPGFAPIGLAAIQRDDDDDPRERAVAVAHRPLQQNDPATYPTLRFSRPSARPAEIAEAEGIAGGRGADILAWGDPAGDHRPEMVTAFGGRVFVTGDGLPGYDWIGTPLPRGSETDLVGVAVRDLAQDGRSELIVTYATSLAAGGAVRDERTLVLAIREAGVRELLHMQTAVFGSDGTELRVDLGSARVRGDTIAFPLRGDAAGFGDGTAPTDGTIALPAADGVATVRCATNETPWACSASSR